jgi:hypothetical protein
MSEAPENAEWEGVIHPIFNQRSAVSTRKKMGMVPFLVRAFILDVFELFGVIPFDNL